MLPLLAAPPHCLRCTPLLPTFTGPMIEPQDPFTALDSTRARVMHSKAPFSATQEGQLLFFLGKWLHKTVVSVSDDLFNRIVAYLAMGVSSSPHDVPEQERQVLCVKQLSDSGRCCCCVCWSESMVLIKCLGSTRRKSF